MTDEISVGWSKYLWIGSVWTNECSFYARPMKRSVLFLAIIFSKLRGIGINREMPKQGGFSIVSLMLLRVSTLSYPSPWSTGRDKCICDLEVCDPVMGVGLSSVLDIGQGIVELHRQFSRLAITQLDAVIFIAEGAHR